MDTNNKTTVLTPLLESGIHDDYGVAGIGNYFLYGGVAFLGIPIFIIFVIVIGRKLWKVITTQNMVVNKTVVTEPKKFTVTMHPPSYISADPPPYTEINMHNLKKTELTNSKHRDSTLTSTSNNINSLQTPSNRRGNAHVFTNLSVERLCNTFSTMLPQAWPTVPATNQTRC